MTLQSVRNFAVHFIKIAAVGGVAMVAIFGHPAELYREGGWAMVWGLFWRNGLATAIFWIGNDYLSSFCDRYFSWTEAPLRRLFISIVLTLLYTSLAFVVVVWIWRFGQVGWRLGTVVRDLNAGTFIPTLLITSMVSLFLHGRSFLFSWKATLIEAERLKKEHISARYETLKNQVNPHFLFNSLNVLSSLVHRDADLAEKFIHQLSYVYRSILENRDKELVPLAEELETLRAYLFLMSIRFGPALQTRLDLPESAAGQVAPLTLQMLAENALKHNEVSKDRPLRLEFFLEDNAYCVVRNNLQKKNILPDSTGLGLDNIRARYRALSGKEVVVEETDGFFTVKVPVL